MTEPIYLPDPANDETLTMTGYDWWRYRAAIETEAIDAFLASPEAARELVEALIFAGGGPNGLCDFDDHHNSDFAEAILAAWREARK